MSLASPDWKRIDPSLKGSAFGRRYSEEIDTWLRGLFAAAPTGVALAAVGSYGRRELAPMSDLDLLLLHDNQAVADGFAAKCWYPVWDAGFRLDYSVRTTKEAIAVANDNMEAGLGLLELRAIAGDSALVGDLAVRWRQQWEKRIAKRFSSIREATDKRHIRAGDVAFLLEPDLKEAKGGLRDIQALEALGVASPVIEDLRNADELSKAREVLLDVRTVLRRETESVSDRLLLQDQDAVAAGLGYSNADELMFVLASAARTVAWSVDESFRRVQTWITGPVDTKRGGRRRIVGPSLWVRDGEVVLSDADRAHDPTFMLRAADIAAGLRLPLAPSTLEQIAAAFRDLPDPWLPATRNALVTLLGKGHLAIPVLEALDHYGLLVRLIPEWESVRCRPQRNSFHRFTVDRHLLETAAQAVKLTRQVARPDILLLGALFHDIGKGSAGDHTEAGIVMVEKIASRLGMSDDDVAVLMSLVRFHLLLPDVATRRDLDDPATLEYVAGAVGNVDTLELLAALTEADSLATGPTAWGPWKARLVADLVSRTKALLHHGVLPEPSPWFQLDDVSDLIAAREVRVIPTDDAVIVVAPDAEGLLATIAGTLSMHKLDVLAATAAADDGMALDRFEVVPSFGDLPNWTQVEEDLRATLDGRLSLDTRMKARYRAFVSGRRFNSARLAEPKVIFDDDASASATRIEVRCPDSPGLLYRLARALTERNLYIRSTKVDTLGHEVVDTFYVTCGAKKITDPELRAMTERSLVFAAGPSG